jgi:Flp pilus assembly protein TadG
MMRRVRSFARGESGAAAAEMALMLPLLVVLLFVTFEGGYFLWNEHKVVKGVRDGVRYAGRQPFASYACPGTVNAAAETAIKNVTRTGFPDGDNPNVTGTDNPTVAGWSNTAPGVTVALSCTGSVGGIYTSNASTAPIVTVSASVPYPSSPLSDLVAVLGFDTNIQLNATAISPVMGI